MKVSDVMHRNVVSVSLEEHLINVARLIFGHGINGVPVVKGKKLVGMLTERDILQQFFPSMQEVVEDFAHARDFEMMEEKINEILNFPVSKIMSRDPLTISPDTPLLRAQSMMQVKEIGRLPVVDSKGSLVGIISNGDIFRAIVGHKFPFEEEEGFYDWLSKHYDTMVDWDKRLSNEMPGICKLFFKEKVKKVLDVTSSTGEHTLALAKKGFEVFGIEASSLMHSIAEKKREESPKHVKDKVVFYTGEYGKLLGKLPNDFDAALFLGDALAHILYGDKNILTKIAKIINPTKSILIFQIINFNKMLIKQNRLRDFIIRKTDFTYEKEQAFLGFYTKIKGKNLLSTRAIFDFDGNKWRFKGINCTPLVDIRKIDITKILKKLGFLKISFYGSRFYDPLFTEPFKPLESDWLIAVARR